MASKNTWEQRITPRKDTNKQHLDQIQELIKLLHNLEVSNANEPSQSCQFVIRHSIDICQNYLVNMLSLEKQRYLMSETKDRNKQLLSQLNRALNLLSATDLKCDQDYEEHEKEEKIEKQLLRDFPIEESSIETQVTLAEDAEHEEIYHQEEDKSPRLDVQTFKQFNISINTLPITSWPNGKGKQLFKYLIIKRASPVPKEILMDVFWPEYDAGSARNNLNVAIYSLRQTLKSVIPEISCILFKHGCYQLNPSLNVWVDSEAFEGHYKVAKKLEAQNNTESAVSEYKKIEELYLGDFLLDDPYEEWVFILRERYKDMYIEVLNRLDQHYYDNDNHQACVRVNKKIVEADPCNEIAHQRLMENYNKTGQRHLALRQYDSCVSALEKKFDLQPSEDMLNLFRKVKKMSMI